MLGEIRLGNEFAGVQDQEFEHLVFVAGQVRDLPVDLDRLRRGIEHDRSAFEHGFRPSAGAAHQRVDARQQFLDVEGFDQVVVRALLQARHLVLPARARGEDQDRTTLPRGAQVVDQLHAGFLRQAEVDDGDVERHLAAEVKAFVAVGRHVHGIAFAFQARGQRLAQRGFVFDQQNAHVRFLAFVFRTNPPARPAPRSRAPGRSGSVP